MVYDQKNQQVEQQTNVGRDLNVQGDWVSGDKHEHNYSSPNPKNSLSPHPLPNRVYKDIPLIGREEDLFWLRENSADVLLVGQPGSGKTYLLRSFAAESGALFIIGENADSICEAVKQQSPSILILDDAHIKRGLISRLLHLRQAENFTFRLIATCWSGAQDELVLDMPDAQVKELESLPRTQIAELVQAIDSKLVWPKELLGEVANQAVGKPGLAVTLAHFCMQKDVRKVVLGDALTADVKKSFKQIIGQDASDILAVFALGGKFGMSMQTVADYSKKSVQDIRNIAVHLAFGGVLRETKECLVVEPVTLRFALVRDTFFNGALSLPLDLLLSQVPRLDETLLVIIGAKYRGAAISTEKLIPLIAQVAERTPAGTEVLQAFAGLGKDESQWSLQSYPKLLIQLAPTCLQHIPATVIPMLLDASIGDERPLNSSLDHGLRLLSDWIQQAYPGQGEAVPRRKTLLDSVRTWVDEKAENLDVALKVIDAALYPGFRLSDADPIEGMKIVIRHGCLTNNELKELESLWPSIISLLQKYPIENWQSIQGWMREWIHPGLICHNISEETYAQMRAFAEVMLHGLAPLAKNFPSVLQWVSNSANDLKISLAVELDSEYEVLFPRETMDDLDDYEASQHRKIAAASDLAKSWVNHSPQTIAEKLSFYKADRKRIQDAHSIFDRTLCERLAFFAKSPLSWAQAFVQADVESRLTALFLMEAAKRKETGIEDLLQQCITADSQHWGAIPVALSCEGISTSTLELALSCIDESMAGILEDMAIRNEIPVGIAHILLGHENNAIAGAIAFGIWYNDPHGQVEPQLQESWRAAVIRGIEDKYNLPDMLSADDTFAFDWFVARVNSKKNHIDFDFLHRLEKRLDMLVALLTIEQRTSVLRQLPDPFWQAELIKALVGNELKLYSLVLSLNNLRYVKLAPLRLPINAFWYEKALLALDAGISAEKIAYEFLYPSGKMRSISVEDSKKTVAICEPLLAHKDFRIQQIGKACEQYAKIELLREEKEAQRKACEQYAKIELLREEKEAQRMAVYGY